MKTHIILLISLLVTCKGISQSSQEEPEVLITQLVSDKKVAGIAAGYAVENEVVWQSAAGHANQEIGIDFESNTIVRLASIAKPMTALAVMQLVEKELIDIDEPIQTYLPDFPQQQKTQITTRHLLSHTSGIDGYKNVKEAQTVTEYPSLTDAVEVFKHRKLNFEPGTRYHYTTYGYTLLGLLIEKVGGVSYEEYMQENIWNKADMTHTGVDKFGVNIENKSALYHRNKKGKIVIGNENNLSNRIPGGGIYSTLEDMLKFGDAVLNNTLVKESTLDLMRQHHSLEKENNAYGFGWFLYNPKPDEGAIIGHSGGQTGSTTQLFIIPSRKTVVVVLSNTSLAAEEVGTLAAKLYAISKLNE